MELMEGLQELERLQHLQRLASNMTDDDIAAALDPSRPPPPPRNTYPSPCECELICSQQFRLPRLQTELRFAYDKIVNDSEAEEIIDRHLSTINDSRNGMGYLYAVHGQTITSRWRKKSRDKRTALLLQIEPELEPKQWIIPRHMSDKGSFSHKEARKHRKTWLLSWLNVESLKDDPARLLGMLNNRGRFSPKDWSLFDNENLMLGYNEGFLAIKYNLLCVVIHGSEYGKLVPWEEKSAHRWDIVGFPRGELILEAQATLLKFLLAVIEELTTDLNGGKPDDGFVTPKIQKVEFKRSGHVELWSKYINRPYSEPPTFDIEALISISQSRVNEIGDHVWLMQTDSAYMRRVLRTAVQVIPLDRDLTLNKHQVAHTQAVYEINVDNGTFASWNWILEDCQTIKTLQEKYGDEIQPGKSLPLEYEIALQSLETLLSQQIHSCKLVLQDSFPQRSGFRDLFEFDTSGPEIKWRKRHGKRRDAFWDGVFLATEPLYWCLSNLVEHPEDRLPFRPSMIFAFLDEYLATCSKEERARMDERLYDQLSNYAALDEMHNAVKLHRPSPDHRRNVQELTTVTKSRAFKFTRSDRTDTIIHKKLKGGIQMVDTLVEFLNTYDADAQVGKKTDKMRLHRFDTIQSCQDAFWNSIRQVNRDVMKLSGVSDEDAEHYTYFLTARSKPDFIAALKSERQAIVDNIEKQVTTPSIAGASSTQYTQQQWGPDQDQSVVTQPSIKPKRRRQAPTSEPSLTALNIDPEKEEEALAPMPVKQQTFSILTAMFTTSSKTVDWDAFVTAMCDVGFSARHERGSEVGFEIEDWEKRWVGKIVFHKPHPVAKIEGVMLRGMGRRMGRWFGWGKETFVLAG